MKNLLKTPLCVTLCLWAGLFLASGRVYAQSAITAKFISVDYVEHSYQTYGENHYITYNIFLAVWQQKEHRELLFATFGVTHTQVLKELSDWAQSRQTCLEGFRDDAGTYSIGRIPRQPNGACISGKCFGQKCWTYAARTEPGDDAEWHKYPYSKALMTAMCGCVVGPITQ